MQRGNVYPTSTDPTRHFLGALDSNEGATLDLPLDTGIAAGRHCRSIVRHLTIIATQQYAWEVVFFSRRGFQMATLGENAFLAHWRFTASDGVTYPASPYYYYQAENIDLPYADHDFEDRALPDVQRGGNLHLLLVNRSPFLKPAGAAGALMITAYLEPTYG